MAELKLAPLPPKADLETKAVLKQLARSHRALAELKGFADTIPNKNILINAVTINEAKDSSEIENIITTHDELFKAMSQNNYINPAAKEVVNYRSALWQGYMMVKEQQLLTTNMIIEIQSIIEQNQAGLRKLPGTVLLNEKTGKVVYTPPGTEEEIRDLLINLVQYINEDFDGADPLIKLAVIHYQFESIHPFYDGNGRTGRIINVLYLVLKELLDSPILYLSRYIIMNKTAYYRLFEEVRKKHAWEDWILYMLEAVEETAIETLALIKKINQAVNDTAAYIRTEMPKIYSKELIELIFYEFYTKITYIEEGLGVTRKTASGYLNALEKRGVLKAQKLGKEKVYINQRLYEIVENIDR